MDQKRSNKLILQNINQRHIVVIGHILVTPKWLQTTFKPHFHYAQNKRIKRRQFFFNTAVLLSALLYYNYFCFQFSKRLYIETSGKLRTEIILHCVFVLYVEKRKYFYFFLSLCNKYDFVAASYAKYGIYIYGAFQIPTSYIFLNIKYNKISFIPHEMHVVVLRIYVLYMSIYLPFGVSHSLLLIASKIVLCIRKQHVRMRRIVEIESI